MDQSQQIVKLEQQIACLQDENYTLKQRQEWTVAKEKLPATPGVYLVTKPYSQYIGYACSYFDGFEFDCPIKYIGKWRAID